ncbi:unnamed protein product [Rotaria socialis]|uniref:Gametogenetin-binding protein 2 n=1 Tax=Rotaria socialis TaxID=392032 RepID=A0A820XJU1_9BILA|nr:unnamed protein product [Rotaria socialis]CAF3501083.1 unnamed protein product [Rotaria socialis]CAF3565163.1 unnamed protein product [Rotaria socialis]CAF4431415.1 unnamed protein product [Rotaria socialis]CAF4533581.1 unnamed protein product [Rotaria socialis]
MDSCDPSTCMSPIKPTARLVAVCQKEQVSSFDKRQIPINIDENLIMKLQVDDACITGDHHCCNKKTKKYETFINGYKKLTMEELNDALCVPSTQIKEYILHSVPCIGCRTSIENFIKSLLEHHHSGLEPLIMNEKASITVTKIYSSNPDNIYTLFYVHGSKLNSFIESIPKSKKNRRCIIHSLDKSKSINDWELVWDSMNEECRDTITLIEADCLLDTLENYLHKHKFCSECKLKVLEAYDILLDNGDNKHRDKKGYCPALYEGLRSCTNDKHIHIDSNKVFIGNLIARAESEIQDSRRERHAKTLDIAQEEILTCIGIYLFERFDKIYRTMRSEEQTWQLLFYIGIDCLRLNFEKAVDGKQDFSRTLQILCDEFREADELKVQKKQQKRSKRKARRQMKTNENNKRKANKIREEIDEKPTSRSNSNDNKQKTITRRRTSSCCSCLCHSCDERSKSLSISHTTLPSASLVKSQSCPSSLLFTSECTPKQSLEVNNKQKMPLSSSLETLFSSVSTRECACHGRNLEKQQVSCDECPTSSSLSCIRCLSTRTDLGYSSGQDETCSFGPCECSLLCDGCLTELPHCCPLHEEDENSDEHGESVSPCNSVLSSGIYSHNCCVHNTLIDLKKTIELCDTTGKHTLKLQLSQEYPFFHMDLKQAWDENTPIGLDSQIFISDNDLHRFFMLNKNFDIKRAQLRDNIKLKFLAWKQRLPYEA